MCWILQMGVLMSSQLNFIYWCWIQQRNWESQNMTLNSFFQRHAWLGFWFHVVFFPLPVQWALTTLNVSLSSLVHLAYLRDGHEDAREGAASSLHASLNTSPVAKTHMHTHTQPSYAFLLALTSSPTPLTCCVSVRPLKMFSSTLPPALSRCISIVSIESVLEMRGERWQMRAWLKIDEWMNVFKKRHKCIPVPPPTSAIIFFGVLVKGIYVKVKLLEMLLSIQHIPLIDWYMTFKRKTNWQSTYYSTYCCIVLQFSPQSLRSKWFYLSLEWSL